MTTPGRFIKWCGVGLVMMGLSGVSSTGLAFGPGGGGHGGGRGGHFAGPGGHYAVPGGGGWRGGWGGGWRGGWGDGWRGGWGDGWRGDWDGWRGWGWGWGGFGLGLGAGALLASPYYDPYPWGGYYVPAYPTAAVVTTMPASPPVSPQGTTYLGNGSGSAPPQGNSWFYCDSAKAYYPYVKHCPEPWREVPATPPGPVQR